VFRPLMRRRELSKAAESSAGCADKSGGHMPPEHGAALAATNLKMAAA